MNSTVNDVACVHIHVCVRTSPKSEAKKSFMDIMKKNRDGVKYLLEEKNVPYHLCCVDYCVSIWKVLCLVCLWDT